MLGLTIGDFLLAPVYLWIVSYLAKMINKRYKYDPALQYYFKWGFRIKMFVVIIYSILSATIIVGDQYSFFFKEGEHFADLAQKNYSNIDLLFMNAGPRVDDMANFGKGYLMLDSNYMLVKISMFLCFFTFSKFLLINIILGFIGFLGSWQLFRFFRNLKPEMHKMLAFACMGIPTAVFWSSGINKETICMASLGFLTKSLFDIFNKAKRIVFNSLVVITSCYLIYIIKPYIFFSYLPFFLFFLLINVINKTKRPVLKWLYKVTIPTVFIIAVFLIFQSGSEFLLHFSTEKVLGSVKGFQNSFIANEDYGSSFSIGEFDGNMGSLLRMAPMAVIATFFRPFPWECHSLIMLFSSLEGLALMGFILWIFTMKKGLRNFFTSIFSDPLVIYCFYFGIIFSLFVGITTFNFGSLARYKMPCMPFFVISLMIIYSKSKISPPRLKSN